MRGLAILGLVCGLISSVDAAPKKAPPKALVLVIDRSGSMQGPKLEAAKNAVLAAISSTNPADTVAVVAFDSEASVYVRPQPSSNRTRIADDVARLTSGGGTNIFPGLKEAFELLQPVKAAKKHVIVLSDGEAPSDGLVELVEEMVAAKITVSTVGVEGADVDLLKKISDAGGGRFYEVKDLKSLSKVFVKETAVAFR